ncbi:MAG: efflux transporter outer membrane subunit [Proteobacteria bacterium]|nr:efflux transporter outer membrane subunit [Pseudomonadota bacterium]
MTKGLSSILLLGALVAGCVPAPPTTSHEKTIEASSLGLNGDVTPSIGEQWWTELGDDQLDRLVAQALAGNPSLAAALARVRAAQAQFAAARSNLYPQASLDGNETWQRLSATYIYPPPLGGSYQWMGTIQANLTWSLDYFGKQQAQIERAQSTARAAALDATAARLALAGSVTQAYIAFSRACDLVAVAEQTVRQQEDVLKLTAGRVTAGLETEAAQQQSQALAAFARQDLAQARATRELAVHQIALLIGRGADAYALERPRLTLTALTLPEVLPADLLSRRADIGAAQARIAAATAGRDVARRAFYPDINLLGLVGVAALSGVGPLLAGQAVQYGIGAALHLPIFDAGKLRANLAGATADLDAAVADYNGAVVGAVKQAADALTAIRAVEDQLREQKTALTSARTSFNLARTRYQSGLTPQLNVLSAEDLLIRAQRQSATLDADLLSARVTLIMALGGGFAPPSQVASRTPGPSGRSGSKP